MDAIHCDVASTTLSNWHDIVWPDVYRVVGRLQVRIAKATKAGEWRKVKRLQRLLTQSTSAKALAVRRVTENRGSKTPGVDRETWSTPTAKHEAMMSLHNRDYKPLPLRRIHIPKSYGDKRPLGIPTEPVSSSAVRRRWSVQKEQGVRLIIARHQQILSAVIRMPASIALS